ncbi:MAG: protein phosphatase 2C domain-containing protein [Deltaproteobacteria bacterium]|nr:protein phosphatase 2C domain-containing protein [Deltaproteobacteria bacterium]
MRPLSVQFSARTDVGRVRPVNEDNYLVDRKLKLYLVCDGLGGHRGGEVASAMAVNIVREVVLAGRHALDAYGEPVPVAPGEAAPVGDVRRQMVEALLRDAVRVANARIHERAADSPTLSGMGTTLALLLVVEGDAFVVHVGDARVYRLRDGVIARLTHDHTLASELGGAAPPALGNLSHQVTRAVGIHEDVEVDVASLPIMSGDRFLLASDGLHGQLPDPEIARILAIDDVAEAASQLVDRANHAGGHDNVTVIVVRLDQQHVDQDEPARSPLFDAVRATAIVLAPLEDDELATVLQGSQLMALLPHGVLVQEGQPLVGLYLVADGEAQVTRGGEAVTTLKAGDFFGEDALLGERTSLATVVGAGDAPTSIVVIERAQFEAMQRDEPAMALKIALAVGRALARKVHGAARETAHPRFIFKDPGAMSRPVMRPVPRPRTSPRVLADTEPQLVAAGVTPPELPPSTVLQRPRTATRRLQPGPMTTQPDLPVLSEPPGGLALTPRTRPEER